MTRFFIQTAFLLCSLCLGSYQLKAVSTQGAAYLLDGFEKDLKWETKEWADGAKLELVSDSVTEGKQALRASFSPSTSKGQKKFILRRTLGGRVRDMKVVQVDIFNSLPTSARLALALEADQYYETDAQELKQGWNRGISFRIDGQNLKSKQSNWEYSTGVPTEVELGSIYLLVQTGEANAGVFYIDNMRSAGKPVLPEPTRTIAARIDAAPVWMGLRILKEAKEVYDLLELGVDFTASYHDPFDAREISVQGEFKAPSGKTFTVDGFFYDGALTYRSIPEKAYWRLRFMPSEAGLWTFRLRISNPKGEVASPEQSFTAGPPSSQKNGFVRVSPNDRRYFGFDSGSFYYPLGHNMAWDSQENYRRVFPLLKNQGANWTRLWMSHWSFGIEWKEMGHYRGLGRYNLENSKKLDEVVELLGENGLYAQLVLEFHGSLSSQVNPEWPNNPYNKVQGGPLAKAQDFFTDRAAREIYKRRVRYVVARWGYSPHIMAWEFFNEINFADDFSVDSDFAWHKDMSQWLKELDPYKHLITTSYYDFYNKQTYALPSIDYAQYHAYHQNVWKTMQNVPARFEGFHKPFFFGEFGSDSADGVDAADKLGVFLHAGIWTQAMQASAGNAMPWWWDSLIDKNQLYAHFGALARFLADIDRRGVIWESWQEKWPVKMPKGQSESLRFFGLKSPTLTMGWACDSKGMRYQDRVTPQEFRGLQFYLRDLTPGRYSVEFWNTREGLLLSREPMSTDDQGRILVSLPPFNNDIAFKAKAL